MPDVDLRPFGWAPGSYMGICVDCGAHHSGVDKRAWRCLECAEKLAATAPAPTKNLTRRIRIDLQTPAEKAIRDAMLAVEAMPGDVRLTDAVTLLGKARGKVSDYVDDHTPTATA